MEGFLVSQFAGRFEDGLRQLSTWLKEKGLVYREDVVDGLENAPRVYIGCWKARTSASSW